jgi:hypothetical protein
MAYSSGGLIAASDYNGIVGNVTNASTAYASEAAANATFDGDAIAYVQAMYGVGFKHYGYGLSAVTLPQITAGSVINDAEWDDLNTAASVIRTNTGSTATLPAAVNAGDAVTYTANWGDLLADLRTKTFAGTVSATANTAFAANGTQTYGSAWAASIAGTFRINFANADQARYFFNTGGQLQVILSHAPASPTAQDNYWTNVFSSANGFIGTVLIKGDSATRTGGAGASSTTNTFNSIGYYNLTGGGTFQTLYTGVNLVPLGGFTAYSANDMTIQVAGGGTAANGGPASYIDIRVTLTDQHVALGAGPDSVKAGITATMTYNKTTSATAFAGVATAPTVTVTSAWAGS